MPPVGASVTLNQLLHLLERNLPEEKAKELRTLTAWMLRKDAPLLLTQTDFQRAVVQILGKELLPVLKRTVTELAHRERDLTRHPSAARVQTCSLWRERLAQQRTRVRARRVEQQRRHQQQQQQQACDSSTVAAASSRTPAEGALPIDHQAQ